MPRRAFVIVVDACGVGALPDAAGYGDEGTNTLAHVAERAGGLALPELERLGLGSILPLAGVAPAARPVVHGRLAARGPGKESATGHWELMGAIAPEPLPTYPEGFPDEVLATLRERTGRGFLGNRPLNGLEAIARHGEEHLASGDPILYTSQDSVLQLAAHEDRVPVAELHGLCERVREVMHGEHAVGRVIARPFTGRPGAFERLPGRRDYTIPPSGPTYLEALQAAGVPVHAVGKVADFFAGRGIDQAHPGADNQTALTSTRALVDDLDGGFVFTNLVDTDQVYGHRKDVAGFAAALRRIDDELAAWRERLTGDDLLLVTADHGCDPAHPGTDHTREHVPLLAAFAGGDGHRHDGAMADAGATVHAWLTGSDPDDLPGSSIL